ncbi:MAG: glycosyltransferase family 39 protein [Deltaproteobacteria bacterium]|nr:glycosyltransferase family 39 protein [Deltaproteobacteria bacterium]
MMGRGAARVLVILACVLTTGRVAAAAPITPELARDLYARVGPLREADGCRLTRFDTRRFQITIGLVTSTGAQHAFELGATPAIAGDSRRVGDWWLAVPAPLADACPTTLAAIERLLAGTSAPPEAWQGGGAPFSASAHYVVLAGTFLVLLLGTAHVLAREAAARGAPVAAVTALLLVCAGGLALRLTLSPWTFLHEYYHIAETVSAHLSGEAALGYGRTGPALFRLVGRVFGDGGEVRSIFLTNALLSTAAVPAAAMLVLAVFRSWPQAVCAALLLAVWPQHLRFSAAEDLFVQAITFGLWSLALFASHQRTRRFEDALLGGLAASLATQARPEMIFFPLVVVAFLLCTEPRAWRTLLARPMLLTAAVLAGLLVPHAFDVASALREARAPAPQVPSPQRYLATLVLFDPRITPVVYPLTIAAGAAWYAMRRPGWLLWIVSVYVGFTALGLSIFDNPQYHLRTQSLPTSYLVLLGAGVAPLWMAAWRTRRRLGAVVGIAFVVGSAIGVVARWRGFVGELKDQQLEWAFLERQVPQLPPQGTLLTAVEAGGHNLDAFPEFLLARSGRRYTLVDVRSAARGTVAWPPPAGDVLFYQGMFCYFAFDDEPAPEPMTPACLAVHERYDAEPLSVEDLRTEGYSSLRYAQGGRGVYRIGFFRLKPRN